MSISVALVACTDGRASPTSTATTAGANTLPTRWETRAFVVASDASIELCFGPPIGPGPGYIAGCPGLTIAGLDVGEMEWIELSSSRVVAARLTGVLSDDRTTFSVATVDPAPGLDWYPSARMVRPTAVLTDCEMPPLDSWQGVADAGLTRMPIGALQGDEAASSIRAVAVDDRWMAIACAAGLVPSTVEAVFTPVT